MSSNNGVLVFLFKDANYSMEMHNVPQVKRTFMHPELCTGKTTNVKKQVKHVFFIYNIEND